MHLVDGFKHWHNCVYMCVCVCVCVYVCVCVCVCRGGVIVRVFVDGFTKPLQFFISHIFFCCCFLSTVHSIIWSGSSESISAHFLLFWPHIHKLARYSTEALKRRRRTSFQSPPCPSASTTHPALLSHARPPLFMKRLIEWFRGCFVLCERENRVIVLCWII